MHRALCSQVNFFKRATLVANAIFLLVPVWLCQTKISRAELQTYEECSPCFRYQNSHTCIGANGTIVTQ